MSISLQLHSERCSVCRVHPATDWPDRRGDVVVAVWSPAEMTIVCREGAAPIDAIAAEHDWAVFQTLGKLDFHLVGILAELTSVLAEASVPILAFSSYTSDLILVKGHHLREASEALESAGHQINFR